MVLKEPLDLEYWLVNVFSGTWTIFSLIGILLVTFVCAKYKVGNMAFLMIMVFFGAILLSAGLDWLMVIGIFIFAPILFSIIRRITE
jgi:hypothetical protein